jgi:urocanate hydratase
LVELGSDQTSLHNPYGGGYYPAGMTVEESNAMLVENPPLFKEKVHESLRKQVKAINTLTSRGMKFWDYGNSFLHEASKAGADVQSDGKIGSQNKFKYPSYVEDIMGDIF